MDVPYIIDRITEITQIGINDLREILPSEFQNIEQIDSERMVLSIYLEAIILKLRGPSESNPNPFQNLEALRNLNEVLKKIRIAFNLKADDLDLIFASTGEELSRHEISALFRKEGHKHFKKCNQQLLNVFLEGIRLRNKKAISN